MGGGEFKFRRAKSESPKVTTATLRERRGKDKGQLPFPTMRDMITALEEIAKSNVVPTKVENPKGTDESASEKVGAAREVGGKTADAGTQTSPSLLQYVYALKLPSPN